MRRPDIPAVARLPLDEIAAAFVRGNGGEIYLAGARGGVLGFFIEGLTLFYPVYQNGTVSRHGFGEIVQFTAPEIDIVSPKDLGISEVVWAD
jgi:hypothetical protein